MSYIDSINQAATASQSTNPAEKSDEVLGKQDFLTLLVAQLQNQDPLNPDDPTEFTAQLAQFSQLEQMFNLNESVDSMAASLQGSDKMAALETIGKDVVYETANFKYDGSSVEVGYKLDGYASNVKLHLQHNGTTIKTLSGSELTEGNHFITWDGKTASGQQAPIGDYKIVMEAQAGEGGSVAASPLIKSEVTGVDLQGSIGGTLITQAGEIGFSSILGVYDKNTSGQSTTQNPNSDETTEENSESDSIVDDVVAAAADELTDDSESNATL